MIEYLVASWWNSLQEGLSLGVGFEISEDSYHSQDSLPLSYVLSCFANEPLLGHHAF